MTQAPSPAAANPYVGPQPFREGQRLFGRDLETRELFHELSAKRIVMLYSPSGAGKSSLVSAGLVPKLRERFDVWRPTRVSTEPSAEAVAAGANRYVMSAILGWEEGIPEALRQSPAKVAGLTLAGYAAAKPSRPNAPERKVLIFDQFEEVLTVEPLATAAKRELFAQLGELLRNPNYWALFVLREDHIAALDPFAEQIPTHLRNRYRIDLLRRDQARRAIAGPAAEAPQGGTTLEAGADAKAGGAGEAIVRSYTDEALEQLLGDLSRTRVQLADGTFEDRSGDHVEPVQLQVVCYRLWEQLPADRREITRDDLTSHGDVDTALGSYYAERLAAVAAATGVSERSLRKWFERSLITAAKTRGQVMREADGAGGLERLAVEALLDAHLVRSEQRSGATWYELAHDRLLDPVLADNRAWRGNTLTVFQRLADRWSDAGRPESMLLDGNEVTEVRRWLERNESLASAEDREFLEASVERELAVAEERRLREKESQQASRIRQFALIGVAMLAAIVVLGGLSWFAWNQSQEASYNLALMFEEKATGALERFRTTRRVSESERALLFTLQAFDELPKGSRLPVSAARLRSEQFVGDGLSLLWQAQGGDTGLGWEPNGRRLISGSSEGALQILDAARGGEPTTLQLFDSDITAVAWSPDGSRLAVAAKAGDVAILDFSQLAGIGSEPPVQKFPHPGLVLGLAWSPDGQWLATGSLDSTVRVWNVATLALEEELEGHSSTVWSVSWSPGGDQLVSGSQDKTLRVWDITRGESRTEPWVLSGHRGAVWSVAWNPDGRRVASASIDQTVRIWDLASQGDSSGGDSSGSPSSPPSLIPADPTFRVQIDPAANLPLTGGLARAGGSATVLEDQLSIFLSVSWSPDGRRLASSSMDGTLRVWSTPIGGALPELEAVVGEEGATAVRYTAWSPSGKALAHLDDGKVVRVHHLPGLLSDVSISVGRGIRSAAWGVREEVAVGTIEGGVHLLQSETGVSRALEEGGGKAVWSVAWGSDGRLAAGSGDGRIGLWDPTGSKQGELTSPELGELEASCIADEPPVWALAWSPNGSSDSQPPLLASVSGRLQDDCTYGLVRVWNAEERELLWQMTLAKQRMTAVSWSADGMLVATAGSAPLASQECEAEGEELVRFWRSAGEPAGGLPGFCSAAGSVAFSPVEGSSRVSTASGASVQIWNLPAWDDSVPWQEALGQITSQLDLQGHEANVLSIGWSSDGTRLASSSRDGAVLIWDAETGAEVARFAGSRGSVSSLFWSSGSERIVGVSEGGSLEMWRVGDTAGLENWRPSRAGKILPALEKRLGYQRDRMKLIPALAPERSVEARPLEDDPRSWLRELGGN